MALETKGKGGASKYTFIPDLPLHLQDHSRQYPCRLILNIKIKVYKDCDE